MNLRPLGPEPTEHVDFLEQKWQISITGNHRVTISPRATAQPPFDHRDEAIEIIETIGLGNFGGPPPIPDPHYWSYGARIRSAEEAEPLPVNPPISDEPVAVPAGQRSSVPDFSVLARYRLCTIRGDCTKTPAAAQ